MYIKKAWIKRHVLCKERFDRIKGILGREILLLGCFLFFKKNLALSPLPYLIFSSPHPHSIIYSECLIKPNILIILCFSHFPQLVPFPIGNCRLRVWDEKELFFFFYNDINLIKNGLAPLALALYMIFNTNLDRFLIARFLKPNSHSIFGI